MPDSGPITHIEAVQGREEELYRNMTSIPHMSTFKKQDIPDGGTINIIDEFSLFSE